MTYESFKKLEHLRKRLGVSETIELWLPIQLPVVNISHQLLDTLEDASTAPVGTEKAKSEYIINPVLRELKRNNPEKFTSFSGYEFNVDSHIGLKGYCDFILSAASKKGEITAPIFCLVEAKNAEIERGYAQCGAEMYAAQLYNEKEGNPQKLIYGCVTNAFSWCFLKLEDKNLYIDPNYVPLTFAEPHRVLAVLQWILDESLRPWAEARPLHPQS
jgi:hypothetical protein